MNLESNSGLDLCLEGDCFGGFEISKVFSESCDWARD